MKTGFFTIAVDLALVLCSCNDTTRDPSLIKGAWELTTIDSNGTISYDYEGRAHFSAEPHTRKFVDKERVWLFKDSTVSWWSRYEEDGEEYWDLYLCDCSRTYTVAGEGVNMMIFVSTTSLMPDVPFSTSVEEYRVTQLTKNKMELVTVERYNPTDGEPVDIESVYSFKRENTLPDYIKKILISYTRYEESHDK